MNGVIEPGMSENVRACVQLLHEILVVWPKPDHSEPRGFRELLSPNVIPTFDEVELLNRIAGISEFVRVGEYEGRVELVFRDLTGVQHKACFTRSARDTWLLASLKFRCPACFGTGENMGKACTLCDGVGWGA